MPKGVYKRKPVSPETCKKLSEAHSGQKHPMFGKHHSTETREKIRMALTGKTPTDETRRKMSITRTGKKRSKETIEKMKVVMLGSKHPAWKGGVTSLHVSLRTCAKYKEWRTSVMTRDGFTCQECGKVGGYLNADHIKPFARILRDNAVTDMDGAIACQELWEVTNGKTLCCSPCHRKKTIEDRLARVDRQDYLPKTHSY